ncbi:MAG: radical SAM protein [Desulfobulbaceae bacterium]|jgi:hypothetical protein|nr:radical SAM protein [Desulfobulbaceae bacterium]
MNNEISPDYAGFEQGPIRPPSEANSLLIRVTRNCPWNRCVFCHVYKGQKFSLRPLGEVLEDIRRAHRFVMAIREAAALGRRVSPDQLIRDIGEARPDLAALQAAWYWLAAGAESIFIQDANSLIIKPERMLTILRCLRQSFPWVRRITSYARSQTLARIPLPILKEMREAGLSRIHVGMESGSDRLLILTRKGVTKDEHIVAGRRVKEAGIELSEYVMPGLGGAEFSQEHARESALALNAINPDFIRLRTFAMPADADLFLAQWPQGFAELGDEGIARELSLFLETLSGIESHIKSDHILNLFEDMDGILPQDQARLAAMPRAFLALPDDLRLIYQVGRRLGIFAGLAGLDDAAKTRQVREYCRAAGLCLANVDSFTGEVKRRFI